MSRIVKLATEPLNLPLTDPFEISLGVQHEALNILVTVETEAGVVGYGEGSAVAPVTGETQEAALATADAATEIVEGRPIGAYRQLVTELRNTFPGAVAANFAVETAILDAFCREQDIALSELFGGKPEPVETDITIPIVDSEEATRRAEAAVDSGFHHLKIKTGTDIAEDVARVTAVSEAAPEASLKVDANQGWTPKETARFAETISAEGIVLDLIEQPVPADDISGLADVRRRVDMAVAADETVFTPADAIRVVRAEAADAINVKLGKSGPLAAADIVAIAQGANLDLMVGCMLESAIGIHTSAHVVAGSGAFNHVDLDGNLLLAKDVIATEGGPLHNISGPGHGITPSI